MRKYNRIVINGKYMCKKECRGVQRYTKEVLHALDGLVEPGNIQVIIPHKVEYVDKFKNISVIKYGGRFTTKLWQIISYQIYIWKNKAFSINLSHSSQLLDIGIMTIHDVRYLEDIKKNTSLRSKIGLYLTALVCGNAIRNTKEIVTVSEFSKNEIIRAYGINPKKINVCYNAWQHLNDVGFDDSIFNENTKLHKGEYYFTLGGNEKSKNMYWIFKMVQKYPDRMFVMAGPQNMYFPTENVDLNSFDNFIHLGYVSDEKLKSLMKYCRAFLFPSKYEGFGIPPMEAISVGAKVIMSNATCLPEIYKGYVSYFNPDDYDVDLEDLLEKCPENIKDVLNYYSWDKTAKEILDLAKKYVGGYKNWKM